MRTTNKLWLWAYPALLAIYSGFSYLFVDRNLVLSSHSIYLEVQRWLWHVVDARRVWVSVFYVLLVGGLFWAYRQLVRSITSEGLKRKDFYLLAGACIGSLLVAYPALSHDIFNYLFNAKMVLVYGVDPHVSVALDFAYDPWTQFMHNVHTPAPYGYGWTLISLLPSWLGMQRLKLTVLLFRLLMVASLIGLVWFQRRLAVSKEAVKWSAVFLLNPLVLIETVGNIHNDAVMMMLLFSAWWLYRVGKEKSKVYWVAALILLGLSVSIKYASVLVVAGYGLFLILKRLKQHLSLGGAQMLTHVAPLVTARSQRFLPWYLIWSLSFLPFTKEEWLRNAFLVASLAGLLGYVPFLMEGEYTAQVLAARMLILFGLPIGWLLMNRLRVVFSK